jgi:outer membrane protein assembly factor BamB
MVFPTQLRKAGLFGVFLLANLLAGTVADLAAGDWPQILGPHRSGSAEGEKLLDAWPAGGPKPLWSAQVGSGYAGAAIAGNRVLVFHRVGDQERIEALDAASGRSLWKADFEALYRGGIDADKGPRCVPLVHRDKVYALGAAGDLYAVALYSGKKLWTRSLFADYRGDEGYFGAGSTPIIVGERLLVNVGGRGAGIVALDPVTGKTQWQATDEAASYAAPTAVTIGNKPQALFITRYNCVLADPASGKVTTLMPFGKRGPTVNAATPLVFEGKMFLTASYGVGAVAATIDPVKPKVLWSGDDTLSSQYATPVQHDGFIYGIHGREDIGVAELRCIEAATGKVRWKQPGYGVAHLILADGKLLIVGVGGRLALARATPDKYDELATFDLDQSVARALPALAGGRLFVRTGSGGGQLHALQVGQ